MLQLIRYKCKPYEKKSSINKKTLTFKSNLCFLIQKALYMRKAHLCENLMREEKLQHVEEFS
ncbi:CLUMA_CG021206, isoform A [Clunio marinus]|uniref:CLUMA_CG021206, isoform A n=1 Tax=Clunio marinus TaxID=568069 RepID=A0A1J1J6W8_9DIPT|nr:CLUMA_CG021206, isoform A [Clunio marinus]